MTMRRAFRIVGGLEAFSFLILLGIAMPLKYIYGITQATRAPGMIHGLLFLSYVIMARKLAIDDRWSGKQRAHAYLASVIPLGTIIFDRNYLAGRHYLGSP